MDTLEQVKMIIVEQLGVDATEVTAEASFVDDLGADSLEPSLIVFRRVYIELLAGPQYMRGPCN